MLNPEDLKKKTFTKGFRGYEVEEVKVVEQPLLRSIR